MKWDTIVYFWEMLPTFIKLPLRTAYFVSKKIYSGLLFPYSLIRSYRIQKLQLSSLHENFPSPQDIKRGIIFLVPGQDIVTGGLLQIYSMYKETVNLFDLHGAHAFLATLPGDPPLLRYTKFEFNDTIYSLTLLLRYFSSLEYLMLHIPVVYLPKFVDNLSEEGIKILNKIDKVHINILLMNIKNMPSKEHLEFIKEIGDIVTATTAHEAYTTPEVQQKLMLPLNMGSTKYPSSPSPKVMLHLALDINCLYFS